MKEAFDFKKLLRAETVKVFFWIIAAAHLLTALEILWYGLSNSTVRAAVSGILHSVAEILIARILCEILIVLLRIHAGTAKS